jgi:pimeloyl-ACP methyl ester carboxylesterase
MAARLAAIAAWGLGRVDLQAGGPIPAWCLWGDRDDFVDWGEAEARAAGMIPAAVRGGHFPHLEDPAGLWRTIRGLVGEAATGGTA